MSKSLTLNIEVVSLPGGGTITAGDNGEITLGQTAFAVTTLGGIPVRGNKKNTEADAVRELFRILQAGPGTGDRGADAEMAVELWVAETTISEAVATDAPQLEKPKQAKK